MRELALIALMGIGFGLGAYRGTGEFGAFGALNLLLGFGALTLAAMLFVRRWRRERSSRSGAPLRDAALMLAAIVWGAALVLLVATHSEQRLDWTFERRYELAPATLDALARIPGRLRVTLFHDKFDPRTRRTRLLLDQFGRVADVEIIDRQLGEALEEEDVFGIASSNSVVFESGGRFERVDRPSEGALFEAISFLGQTEQRTLYLSAGAGEGDVTSSGSLGFSGLGAALQTEGCRILRLQSPSVSQIPEDADAVLVLAPQRPLHPALLGALRSFLQGGGTLIAMLEPGRQTGIEELLEEFGMRSPNAVIVDPMSDSIDGSGPGINPVVFNYAEHPVTQGLARNRQTFFRGARSFRLSKPTPEDRLQSVVYSSRDAWLDSDAGLLGRRRQPTRPEGAQVDYQPIAVTGRYPRNGHEARIVAFGDSDFARNRDLRSLYNLDLIMNAVHWSTRRESRITLRPKAGSLIQFPLPIQNSLRAFYGVGLLVPELLLASGGLIWLRRRSA